MKTLSAEAEQLNIIATLKKIIRAKKIKYSEIALSTDIPESSLKKILNGRDCNLIVLLKICKHLKMELSDVVRESKMDYNEGAFFFDPVQEDYFCSNLDSYWVFLRFYRKFSNTSTTNLFNGSQKRYLTILKELEEFQLIERHPNGVVKVKASGILRMHDGSRLHDIIVEKISTVFIKEMLTNTDQPDRRLHQLGSVKMTPTTLRSFVTSFREKYMEMDAIFRRERNYHQDEDLVDVTYLLAVAPFNSADIALNPE